jgi:two-component system, chemotaxis family, sensor histidine kinase and response regulator PixL
MASAQRFKDSEPGFLAQFTGMQPDNLKALAVLINHASPQIQVKVACQGDRFGVLLEANVLPDRTQAYRISPIVRRRVQQMPSVQIIKIYGRQFGQSHPAWCLIDRRPLSSQQKLYGYFVTEAQDLLNSLAQDLSSFREDHSLVKIHNMLLAVHTIKGGSASVGLQTIAKIAHGLEDVFAALRHSEASIDLEPLLQQGFESLRSPLLAQFAGVAIDEPEALNRAASVIAQIQAKLGDCFDRETPLLTSAELGFDVVQNLFQVSVAQRLGDLERSLLFPNPNELAVLLKEKAEVFLGLAESMNLPGFGAIAQTSLTALQVNPHRVVEIATLALADFSQGRAAVLGGDRQQGGAPSWALKTLATDDVSLQLQALEADTHSFPDIDPETHWMKELSPLANSPALEAEPSLDDVFGQYSG